MEEMEMTGYPEEPKLEVISPPPSPRDSDDDDDDDETTELDDSDGEEEEGSAAGVVTARRVVMGPPLKKGPWTPEEDRRLRTYVEANGEGSWNTVQRNAGLNRCGKSCRLRWANHLRPHLKKGPFSKEEEQKIIELHAMHGNKWAMMAGSLPGRTDNEIKNFWNTRSKRLSKAGLDLYPDGLLSRVANQDMDCRSPEDSRGKKRPNELSQGSGLEFDDIIFEKLDYKKRAENFLAPTFTIPDSIPVDGMNHPLKSYASSGILSGYSGSPTYEQVPHEAEKTCYTDINPGIARNHSFPFNNAIPNGLSNLGGNFSTSGTIQRPMKMELPLIQHSTFETINSCQSPPFPLATPLELAENCMVSPASVLTKPECFPSQDNGLLGAVVHQEHVPTMFQGAYEGVSPIVYVCPNPPCSSFGNNLLEGSLLDEFGNSQSHASMDAILRDRKHQPEDTIVGKYCLPDTCMLDESSDAGFFNVDSPHSFLPMNGQLNAQLFGGSYDESILSAAGDGHQLGLESATWKSMPGACHMSESRNVNQQQL